jgi:predicted nuclease of restriction endonuclease-like RecB superfamily
MKTQVNVPNSNLLDFIECCDRLQIIYHQIEARENDTRYEIETSGPSTLFYLDQALGLDVANRISNQVYGK